jgi:hypothetical protein
MTEIKVDPVLLIPDAKTELRRVLIERIKDFVLQESDLDREKKKEIEKKMLHLNEKQLIDVLIETIIEPKCI